MRFLSTPAIALFILALVLILNPVTALAELDERDWDNASPSEIHRELAKHKAEALAAKRQAQQFGASDINAPFQLNYDVLYYDIDIRVNDTNEFLYGDVKFVAEATEDGVSSVDFDLYFNLSLDSIIGTSGTLSFSRSINVVNVDLGQTYNTGEQFEFTVWYNGHPIEGGFQAFAFDIRLGEKIIASLSEPYFARSWWPCKDRMDDKPDSIRIALQVDTSLYAASNGVLDSIIAHGDNTHTFHYTERYPIATYLFSVAISNYTVWYDEWVYNGELDTMQLVHAVYPDRYAYSLTKFDITPNALTILSDKFGLYPFVTEKYGHANFEWGGAMEHQTMTSCNSGTFGFSEPVVVHEMTHQWFGDMITCESWEHIWLNEGWASYGEALYFEEINGAAYYRSYMNSMAYSGGGTIWVSDTSSVGMIFHGGRSYDKGAWVCHMLRGVLGDELFFQGIDAYYNSEYKWKAATTEKFRDVFEVATGVELDWFFEDWIYGTYRPNYSWASWTEVADSGGYNVYLNVDQTQVTPPMVFRMPVDYIFSFPSLPDTTIKLPLGRRTTQHVLHFGEDPSQIQLDPLDWTLKYDTPKSWSLFIVTPPEDINDGARNVPYVDTVEARTTSGQITYSMSSGSLPPGLTVGSDGILSGIPLDTGSFTFTVLADDDVSSYADEVEYDITIVYSASGIAGDVNDNGVTNVSDLAYLVAYLFGIPTGPKPFAMNQADVNNTCTVNVSDLSYLVNYLFGIPTGPAPTLGCAP